ncbi:site-specific integrase [Pseudonocardia sichuanensis]
MTTTPPPEPDRSRRARKRGNGEGTISKRADGRYTAAIYVTRPDGTRGRKWIYGRTRAEVATKLADLAQRVQTGSVIPTRTPTLSSYLDYWLKEVAEPKLRPTTLSKYRTAIELYLRPGLGAQRLDKLTVATVQRFLNTRRAAGDSVPKLRMIREVLSSALGRAVREELISPNVAQFTTLPTEQRARRTAWTADQARAFLDAATGDPAHPIFTLALVYGLRRGGRGKREIAALRWNDIDFDNGRIAVHANLVRVGGQLVHGPTKTRAGLRTLPLGPLAREALLAQRERQNEQRNVAGTDWQDTGYIFTTRTGRPVEPRNVSRSFDRIVAETKLPKIVFHDLRRHRSNPAQRPRRAARDAQVILGHANIGVTLGIYSEVFDTQISESPRHVRRPKALGGRPRRERHVDGSAPVRARRVGCRRRPRTVGGG